MVMVMMISEFPNLILGDIVSGINDTAIEDFFKLSQANIAKRETCKVCKTRYNCTG